jgi:hypothetical protein
MVLILHMLGGAVGVASSSTPTNRDHHWRRLQKTPPKRNETQSLYSCKEILDVVQAQSCLTLLEQQDNLSVIRLLGNENQKIAQTNPHIGFFPENPLSKKSEYSISDYSLDEVEAKTLRRTRAKTPVLAVGQLERNSKVHSTDMARSLAEQYQALLPNRAANPIIKLELPSLTPKKLRKIKCQLSLRELIEEHSKRAHSVAYSDAETLVGSESLSLLQGNFEKSKLPIIKSDSHDQSLSWSKAAFDDDIGLKICVDLLTNELANAFFRHHPAEREDRASGLQILLMIEAYETVQQHARQHLCDPHVTEETKDQVNSVDRILNCWLEVLYSVYDLSQERKFGNAFGEDQGAHR